MNLWSLKPGDRSSVGDGAVAEVVSATEDGRWVKVRNIYTGEEHGVEQVDTLVTWLGSRARDDLWHALKGRVGELYAAGGCLAPRSVEAAMREGAEIARSL